jgi:hypothetical protein
MDDDNTQSADDALEPIDEDLQVGRREKLEEDNDSPAAPAPDNSKLIPDDHPQTDSEVDSHELYDEGLTSATDFDAQHEG